MGSDDVPDIPGGLSKVGHRVLHNQVLSPPGEARTGERVHDVLKKKDELAPKDKWIIRKRPVAEAVPA